MQPQIYRWARLAMLALTIGLTILVIGQCVRFLAQNGYSRTDYTIFYAAARSDAPYDVRQLNIEQSAIIGREVRDRAFGNPPSLLLLVKPFAALPYDASRIAWGVFGFAAFGSAVVWGLRQPLGLLTLPVFRGLTDGQVTLVIGGLSIWAMVLLKRRPVLAGLLLALAALIKPPSVLLAPVALLIAGERRAFLGALLGGLALGGLCLAIQGPSLWLAWADALSTFKHYVSDYNMARGVAPSSLALKLGLSGGAALVVQGLGALLGLVLVWRVFPKGDPLARVAALFAGSILCSPYAMDYELAALSVVAMAMLCNPRSHPAIWLGAMFIIVFPPLTGAFGVVLVAAGMLLTPRESLALQSPKNVPEPEPPPEGSAGATAV